MGFFVILDNLEMSELSQGHNPRLGIACLTYTTLCIEIKSVIYVVYYAGNCALCQENCRLYCYFYPQFSTNEINDDMM